MNKSAPYARILVVSLVLNLFLCGIVAGQFLQRGFLPQLMMRPPPMHDLGGILPNAKVVELRTLLKKHFTESREGEADIKNIREEMDALITAETFDGSAFISKASAMHATQSRIFTDMSGDLAAFLSTLTPAERQKLADHFHRHAPPLPYFP